jgi:NAD(P)H-hydrate epimerase
VIRVLAIDIPSGVDALTGAVPGEAVRASATIALAAMKPGLLFEPARAYCGELWIAGIGIDDATLGAHAHTYATLDDDAFLDLLPHRSPDADKRSAGAPLIIAGSAQFPGAAVLCTRAAARAGAGYVTVATAPDAAPVLRAHLTEQVAVTFANSDAQTAATDLLDIAKRNTAVGIGPGLALDEWTGAMIRSFVERCSLPMVIDASALFHFAKHLDLLRGKACVLTPHEGEFARLSGLGTVAPGSRVQRLREFTARTGITTLLKGPATLIDDGTIVHINPTGTSALATAGTGDVLTGIIATLLSQGLSPVDAACAGAYWHGLTARCCARERSVGVIAGDLPEALASALPERAPNGALLRYA